MVKKTNKKRKVNLSDLLQITRELSELFDTIHLMNEYKEIRNVGGIQVKGKSSDTTVLLPTLKKCHNIIDNLDPEGEIFVPIHDEFDDCIDYLDKNYSVKSKWLKTPETLREEDLEKITDALDNILRILIGYSDDLAFMPSNEKDHRKISKLVKDMDKKTKGDLKEALTAYNIGLTTASFMLFCRVAEKLAISYYEKTTKNNSKGKSWNNMFNDIKKIQEEKRVKRSIVALFDFLREKRNTAQHPGTRFNHEDCEKILLYIDDFHKETM